MNSTAKSLTVAWIFGVCLVTLPKIGVSDSETEDLVVRVDIAELIGKHSKSENKKFMLDPRVKATVTLIGIDLAQIDYPTLVNILRLHAFEPIEANGIVYVVPSQGADQTRSLLGKKK